MNTTKILGEAAGIQYQGIADQSESSPATRLVDGVIIGDFERGRTDQPMLIAKDSLARLGDKSKAAYQVVADCLDTGVPSVWVMRLGPIEVNLAGILSEDGIQLLTEDGQFLMPEGV